MKCLYWDQTGLRFGLSGWKRVNFPGLSERALMRVGVSSSRLVSFRFCLRGMMSSRQNRMKF